MIATLYGRKCCSGATGSKTGTKFREGKMQTKELTVIVPVRNIENEIEGILRSLAIQAEGLDAEFLVIDMGSTDGTLLEAVQFFEGSKAVGRVLQSGSFNVSAALNAGIRKACGEYVSFIFVRRLYQNFLKGYLDSARRYSADFVFGCWDESEIKAAERRLISSAVIGAAGTDYMKEILRGHLNLDISALLFKKSLLTEKHIYFSEDLKLPVILCQIVNRYNRLSAFSHCILHSFFVR